MSTTATRPTILLDSRACPKCGRGLDPWPLADGTQQHIRSCYRARGGCGATWTIRVARLSLIMWDIRMEGIA